MKSHVSSYVSSYGDCDVMSTLQFNNFSIDFLVPTKLIKCAVLYSAAVEQFLFCFATDLQYEDICRLVYC